METKKISAVFAACTLVILTSNLISWVTTALGLKASYFKENSVQNALFVLGISAVIQLTKACIERIPQKAPILIVVYAAALVLSAGFSAQAFVQAAYPEARFQQIAVEELNAGYTTQLLNAQNDVGEALSEAREKVWANFDAVRASLDTTETGLDTARMLTKYDNVEGFEPSLDNSYLALERVVAAFEAENFDAAKREAENALAVLNKEELNTDLDRAAQKIDTIRKQMKAVKTSAEGLGQQLEQAVAEQGSLQAKSKAHKLLKEDLTVLLNQLDSGSTSAAQALDALQHAMLQTQQDPAVIRSLLTTVVENAGAGADLQALDSMRANANSYLSLLNTNTQLLTRVEALSEQPTADESWQDFWNDQVRGLRAEIAVSALNADQRDTCLDTLDTLLRRYTTQHTPQEYMLLCLTSKGCLLAWLCLAVAALLDLAGLAANKVAWEVA